MSWSARFVKAPGATAEETKFDITNVDEVPEHLEQYREAITAAFGILLSGVVGDSDKSYKITLAGHGNPDHQPVEGAGNDWLLIEITQVEDK